VSERDRGELQAVMEAALRADREARQRERDDRSAHWGGLAIAFLLIGLPLLILLVQNIDSQNDHFMDCSGVTYTGDAHDYPGCHDRGPVP